ncbi:hypothetical protein MASR2M78_17830 [Treponema sp.]
MRQASCVLSCLLLFPCIIASAQARALTYTAAAEAAINSASELHYRYASKKLRTEAWRLSLRAYFPQLSISMSEDDRLSQNASDSFVKSFGLSLSQLLWDGGRTSKARSLEEAELCLLQTDIERELRNVGKAAVQAYRQVLLVRTIFQVKTAALAYLEEQRLLLGVELARGLAREIDGLEASIAVREAELERDAAALQCEEAEQMFMHLLGLQEMPVLIESIDTEEPALLFKDSRLELIDFARTSNPELKALRFSVAKKQAELRSASHSWLPTLGMSAGFRVHGDEYPLTRSSWNVALNLQFSSPLLKAGSDLGTGWEPPFDRTAQTSLNTEVLSDPASILSPKSAALALRLESNRYADALMAIGPSTLQLIRRYELAYRQREHARSVQKLASEQLRLGELNFELGRSTRADLMTSCIQLSQKQIALYEAAVALLVAQTDLESLLDLSPGGLRELVGKS